MTTITQAAYIVASSNKSYWLHQKNRDLPYGDIDAMVAAARDEGATVTQISGDRFLVNYNAWVKVHGCVDPI